MFGTLLTDIWKAFDCLPNEFLIAKSNAHAFRLRNQTIETNELYNSWEHILFGMFQSLVLQPILFNIFLSDLFLTLNEVTF